MQQVAMTVGETKLFCGVLCRNESGSWRQSGGAWTSPGDGSTVSLRSDDDVVVVKGLLPGVTRLRFAYPQTTLQPIGTGHGGYQRITSTVIAEIQISVIAKEEEPQFDYVEIEDITRGHIRRSSW